MADVMANHGCELDYICNQLKKKIKKLGKPVWDFLYYHLSWEDLTPSQTLLPDSIPHKRS